MIAFHDVALDFERLRQLLVFHAEGVQNKPEICDLFRGDIALLGLHRPHDVLLHQQFHALVGVQPFCQLPEPHRVLRLVRESDFLEIFLGDQLAVMQLLQIWHKEGPKGLLVLTNDHDLFYEVRCQDGVLNGSGGHVLPVLEHNELLHAARNDQLPGAQHHPDIARVHVSVLIEQLGSGGGVAVIPGGHPGSLHLDQAPLEWRQRLPSLLIHHLEITRVHRGAAGPGRVALHQAHGNHGAGLRQPISHGDGDPQHLVEILQMRWQRGTSTSQDLRFATKCLPDGLPHQKVCHLHNGPQQGHREQAADPGHQRGCRQVHHAVLQVHVVQQALGHHVLVTGGGQEGKQLLHLGGLGFELLLHALVDHIVQSGHCNQKLRLLLGNIVLQMLLVGVKQTTTR
mmetsp:Transcript_58859/g.96705  ORF Transcript_58859/g.96705 Transcript_58859/m.96705 type:complete len:398 (+) Transcript_58859:361-1554(+)